MTRSRCTTFFARAAIVPLAALAVAGYGGVSSANVSTAPQEATKAKPATVRVAKTNLGKILVNSKGRTLYLFQADQGTTSVCADACAANWPPLKNAAPKAGKGAKSSLLTTSTRADGKTQVVYNGHPLYTFQADTKAGNTNGQGRECLRRPLVRALTRRGTRSPARRRPLAVAAARAVPLATSAPARLSRSAAGNQPVVPAATVDQSAHIAGSGAIEMVARGVVMCGPSSRALESQHVSRSPPVAPPGEIRRIPIVRRFLPESPRHGRRTTTGWMRRPRLHLEPETVDKDAQSVALTDDVLCTCG